ncbi:MAG TPA: response regulator transcription factor [Blastocatellia bacterium]|nr:response regulator transcription factor [Blastocatellia bacterium]
MSHPSSLVILLLEDQTLVRAGMRALIQISEPYAVIHEASSYEEAVAKVRDTRVDIAFLDVDLKQTQTGLDFLRYMRSQELDTRAIMLSGRAEKEIVMECIEAGASGYILKDMETDGVFRRALDTIFQGNIFLPASVIGRGGFSPSHSSTPANVSAESLGVTGRSLEVLYYLCQGLPNKTIAKRMQIEEATVRKDYVTRLFRLFRVARRTELIVEVSRRGISVPTPQRELA